MDEITIRSNIVERVIVRRMPEPGSFGWMVLAVRASGPHKGKEHCLAMVCGGTMGKLLAVSCARQIADTMMIERIEFDADLASTED